MTKDQDEIDLGIGSDLQDAEFDEELNEWLGVIAQSCVAHMQYVEECEAANPKGLDDDDYGMLELERGFLVLYALQTKGGIPISTKTQEKH